jgi:hypothetical protein
MLDRLRTLLHRAMTTEKGDSLAAIRFQKEVARGVNELLGEPLCSREELEKRRAARARLAELRKGPRTTQAKREPAPVMIYFEKDRNHRELQKVKDLLAAHAIVPRLLDVTGDAATLDFVLRETRAERDELPQVFVGAKPVGGYRQLVAFDVSGELKKAVFG